MYKIIYCLFLTTVVILTLPGRSAGQIDLTILRDANHVVFGPDDTTEFFSGISSSNERNCTAVGTVSSKTRVETIIIRTNDGGSSWTRQVNNLPIKKYTKDIQLQAVCAVDSLHVFVCGDSGIFLRTSDAGATWVKKFVPTNSKLYDVHFYDSLHGMVCGFYGTAAITSNAGETWTVFEKISYTTFYHAYGFARGNDLSDHWAMYDQYHSSQFTTRDTAKEAGFFWDSSFVFKDHYNGMSYKWIFNVFFLDSLNGFIAGTNKGPENTSPFSFRAYITRTSDGGKTWNTVYDSSLTNQTELTAITFYSRLMGIAAAKYNTLLYTIDGGNTWIEYSINQPHTFALIGQMCPAGNNAFYGINQDGSSGQIFRGTISPKGKVHSNDQAIVDIKLYPQPAHNVVSLGGIEAFGQQCKVSISSCLGTIEMTKHFVSGEGTAYSIDVSTLTSGFHYITIENTQGNRVTKPLMILR